MAGAGGYFADPSEPARPAAVRVLRVLLWADAGLTAVMFVAGLLAAGISLPVLTGLLAMAWPGAVAGVVAWRLPRRPHIAWPLSAAAWQIILAVSELLGGDPRGLTSMLLPLSIAVLLATPPVRTYARRPPVGSYGDGGASLVEYAALVVLAALILGSLATLGLPSRLRTGTESAVCRIFTSGSCGNEAGRTPPNASRNAAPNGGPNGGTNPEANPNGGTPTAKPCHGLLDCAWQAIRTDPHDAVKDVHCDSVLHCIIRGAGEAIGSQWNLDKAILEDGKGIVDLARNPGSLIDAANYIRQHPGEALRQLVWDDESANLWHHGNYVGAVTRGIWNVGSWLIPGGALGKTLSKAGKFGRLGKLVDKAGDLSRLSRTAREASKAADDAERLAAKGDYQGARKSAENARRRAGEAEDEARKKGCKVVSLGALPRHFGGRSAAPAEEDGACGAAGDAERNAERATERVWERTLDDPESLRGMNPEEVRKMIPKSWSSAPAKKGDGIRYAHPKNKGEQVIIEGPVPGYDPPNIHAGKYIKVSHRGVTRRIPLEGNPAL